MSRMLIKYHLSIRRYVGHYSAWVSTDTQQHLTECWPIVSYLYKADVLTESESVDILVKSVAQHCSYSKHDSFGL